MDASDIGVMARWTPSIAPAFTSRWRCRHGPTWKGSRRPRKLCESGWKRATRIFSTGMKCRRAVTSRRSSSPTCSYGSCGISSGPCANRLFRDQFGLVTPIFDASGKRRPKLKGRCRPNTRRPMPDELTANAAHSACLLHFPWSKRGVHDDIRGPPT